MLGILQTCRRARPGLSAGTLLWLVLAVSPAFAGETRQSFSVDSIHPSAAHPGERVLLQGGGLDDGAADYLPWVRTASAGFLLDGPVAVAGGLKAVVGPVAYADTGSVEVWRGRAHALPPRTRRLDGRMVTTLDGRVFVAHHFASQGPAFSALSGSLGTVSSRVGTSTSPGLVVDFDRFEPPPPGIRVDAVIETGGSIKDPGGTGGGGGGGGGGSRLRYSPTKSGAGPAWAFHLGLELDAPFVADGSRTGAERLVAALARVLNDEFASMGLVATADGSKLVLDSTGGIVGGFVTVVADGG